MRKYYVYCHCFEDTNEIFYIGKGSGRRHLSKQRTPAWKSLVENRNYCSMKIKEGMSENEAIDFENELLQVFNTEANISQKSSRVKKISYASIKDIAEYDESSPTFLRYKVARANGAIPAGTVAGSFDSYGYGQVYIRDRIYKTHRVIYCLVSGKDLDSSLIIDHIDGDKSNNNMDNLRLTTLSENTRNIVWESVKPTNTGERAISLRDESYRVLWTENGKQRERTFSYRRSKRSKEEAFEEAINFRDSLIKSGLIKVVTRD